MLLKIILDYMACPYMLLWEDRCRVSTVKFKEFNESMDPSAFQDSVTSDIL